MSVLYAPAPRLFADLAIAYGMSVAFATQSANCAQRTAGPDVNRTSLVATGDVAVRRGNQWFGLSCILATLLRRDFRLSDFCPPS